MLKPDKPKKGKSKELYIRPEIPPHLAHLKMETKLSKNCKWSLSGPQFPKPTAIQQRYCYPEGNDAYAATKGGSLWTMFNRDGNEDKEYRLLHVYYSTKRANNVTTKENPKRKKETVRVKTGMKKQRRSTSKTAKCSRLPEEFPSSRAKETEIFRRPSEHVLSNTESMLPDSVDFDLPKHGSFESNFEGHKIYPVPSILLDDENMSLAPDQTLFDHPYIFEESESVNIEENQVQHVSNTTREFNFMVGVPLVTSSLVTKEPNIGKTVDVSDCFLEMDDASPENLMQKLSAVHKKIIYEWIGCRPSSERGQLVSVVANWARSVSRSPLEIRIPGTGKGEKELRDIPHESDDILEDFDVAIAV